jgi:sulfite exporter TauE/SafE
MNLWSVFATGLLAGGASCAVVQGGLLAGAVARRHDARPDASRGRLDDAVPVGGFLAGKLVSHTAAGALLGLIGDAAQLGFRTRAIMQIAAGVLMILMAAHLLGLRALRKLVPAPPPAVTRFIRRSARSEAVVAPAILGFLTILIPCGVTLSVMVLAVASGSPLTGAVGMALFVLGTSPLFAALGYGLRRSADLLRGYLGKAAAVAVIVAGVLSINSGLVLRGSSFTLERAWDRVLGRDDTNMSMNTDTGMDMDMDMGGSDMPMADNSAVTVDAAGVQHIRIEVRATSYSPSRVQARGGLPTKLTLQTSGNRDCTRGFVIPAMNLERTLPETGETMIDLGTPAAGRIDYVCSAGMYRGVIEVL